MMLREIISEGPSRLSVRKITRRHFSEHRNSLQDNANGSSQLYGLQQSEFKNYYD
jgi:hypothetical protein